MKKIILALATVFGLATCFAQQKVVADKICGIVGDKIVLKSEVYSAAVADPARQGLPPQDQCAIFDQMLISKALVLQAEKDSLPVSDEDVDAELDQRVRFFVGQYGGKDQLEQIAGKSIYQLKEDMRPAIREQRLASAMRNKIVQEVKITPAEVKEFFDRIPKDKLQFLESQIQIREIVVFPKASRDIEKLAMDELNEYKRQIEAGTKKIDMLAKLYSDDPAAKENGGRYDMNRADKQWDPAFMSNAFRLKEGQVSPVFKSKFGYHIIQLETKNGDDIVVKHILRIPQITDPEIKEATLKLDTIRKALIDGYIGFGEAVARFSDDDQAKFTAGMKLGKDGSSYLTIDQLDKDNVLLLKGLKPGDYSQPTVFTDATGKKGVHIIQLVTRSEPHVENLRDDYNLIAQRALDEKKSGVMEKWFISKIPTYFVMIDSEFKKCGNLAKWESAISTASN
ncbi:MAG: peptidylprolyl isomerase [Puia sp.]|nr:peptidylprolyl isomerase [Puia sp.]